MLSSVMMNIVVLIVVRLFVFVLSVMALNLCNPIAFQIKHTMNLEIFGLVGEESE